MGFNDIFTHLNEEKKYFSEEDFETIVGLLKKAKSAKAKCESVQNKEEAKVDVTKETTEDIKETNEKQELSEEKKNKAEKFKNEGNEYLKSKNYDDAILSYTQAIEENPNNHIYYSNRAAAYAFLNMDENGIDDCKKAIELCPSFVKAYIRLGDFYAKNKEEGDLIKANDYYKKGLELDPMNMTLKNKIKTIESSYCSKDYMHDYQKEPTDLKNMDFSKLMQDPKFMEMAQSVMKGKSQEDIEKMMNMFKGPK